MSCAPPEGNVIVLSPRNTTANRPSALRLEGIALEVAAARVLAYLAQAPSPTLGGLLEH